MFLAPGLLGKPPVTSFTLAPLKPLPIEQPEKLFTNTDLMRDSMTSSLPVSYHWLTLQAHLLSLPRTQPHWSLFSPSIEWCSVLAQGLLACYFLPFPILCLTIPSCALVLSFHLQDEILSTYYVTVFKSTEYRYGEDRICPTDFIFQQRYWHKTNNPQIMS